MAKYKAKARVTKDQALKLQPLFSKFDKLYATENTIQREIINQQTISPTAWFQNFLGYLGLLNQKGVGEAIGWIHSVSKDGVTQTQNVIKAWNSISKYMSGGLELGHGEWSVVGTRCHVIYMGLLMMYDDVKIANTMDPDNRVKIPELKVIDKEKWKSLKPTTKLWTEQQLKKAVEDTRQLWIISQQISKLPKNTEVGQSMNDLKHLVHDYLDNPNQEQHTLTKETGVNVAAGEAKLNLIVETTQLNSRVKAPLEKRLGKSLNMVMRKTQSNFLKEFKNVKWGNLVGSKSVSTEIVKQISDIAIGKTPKPSKSITILRKKGSTKRIKNPSFKKLIKTPIELKELKITPKVSVEKKEPTDPQLRYRIQQGLRKRLQANMHRPNLIYRTGTFARSVKLLTLTENEKGELYGRYTYQLNPYLTFENTGRWPAGYNPKRVITQSIRELAQEKAQKRIAYLRRT